MKKNRGRKSRVSVHTIKLLQFVFFFKKGVCCRYSMYRYDCHQFFGTEANEAYQNQN